MPMSNSLAPGCCCGTPPPPPGPTCGTCAISATTLTATYTYVAPTAPFPYTDLSTGTVTLTYNATTNTYDSGTFTVSTIQGTATVKITLACILSAWSMTTYLFGSILPDDPGSRIQQCTPLLYYQSYSDVYIFNVAITT